MLACFIPGANGEPDGEPILRAAKLDDVGMVHRVVITSPTEGYALLSHGCYNLHTWSPVRMEYVRIGRPGHAPEAVTIRITTMSLREPRVGDKFASRHGQKGTVGQLIDQTDLPFTRDGITPDILFNSHGIPSRMTMGQMWECVISKLNAMVGDTGRFGVPFTPMEELMSGKHLESFVETIQMLPLSEHV